MPGKPDESVQRRGPRRRKITNEGEGEDKDVKKSSRRGKMLRDQGRRR